MSSKITKGRAYAKAAPGANTNILTNNIKIETPGSAALRITVALTTASVFNMRVTDGTTAYDLGLNNSVALAAGDLYTFTVAALKHNESGVELEYNFQVETDSVIRLLVVEEITGGVL